MKAQPDPDEPKGEGYLVFKARPYLIAVRLRKNGALDAKPIYMTVTFYPALRKESMAEKVWLEFGYGGAHWIRDATLQKGVEFYEVYIPTDDPRIAINAGTLRRQPQKAGEPLPWMLEESPRLLDLMHGRFVPDLEGAMPTENPFGSWHDTETHQHFGDMATWFDNRRVYDPMKRPYSPPPRPKPHGLPKQGGREILNGIYAVDESAPPVASGIFPTTDLYGSVPYMNWYVSPGATTGGVTITNQNRHSTLTANFARDQQLRELLTRLTPVAKEEKK